MNLSYDIDTLGLMISTLNAAVASAKRKDPNFLKSKLVDRYSPVLSRLGQIILGESHRSPTRNSISNLNSYHE
jgi:hypothetical protein